MTSTIPEQDTAEMRDSIAEALYELDRSWFEPNAPAWGQSPETEVEQYTLRAAKVLSLPAIKSLQAENLKMREALAPFANVAEKIRTQATDERWGDESDPAKWSLTGRAFDKARASIAKGEKE